MLVFQSGLANYIPTSSLWESSLLFIHTNTWNFQIYNIFAIPVGVQSIPLWS